MEQTGCDPLFRLVAGDAESVLLWWVVCCCRWCQMDSDAQAHEETSQGRVWSAAGISLMASTYPSPLLHVQALVTDLLPATTADQPSCHNARPWTCTWWPNDQMAREDNEDGRRRRKKMGAHGFLSRIRDLCHGSAAGVRSLLDDHYIFLVAMDIG